MSRAELSAALDALAQAHGSSELAAAFRGVQRHVRNVRRGDAKVHGRLSTAIIEAWDLRKKLKADGLSGAELDKGLEAVLRDFWPFTREWKFICADCHDSGFQVYVCRRGQRCSGISTRTDGPRETALHHRRICATNPESDYEHEYGQACFCARGERFRAKPKPEASDFTDAGKGKRSDLTRFGR